MIRILTILAALLMAACASKPLPQLGVVDGGIYHDAGGRFACPMPGAAEGFGPDVTIRDAAIKYRDQMVYSEMTFDNGRYTSTPVTPYMSKVKDGYRPAPTVRFIDAANPSTRLEVSTTALRDNRRENFRANGEKSQVYREYFEHGNLGLLDEAPLAGTPPMRMGLVQFPYWSDDMGYMGVNLAAAYKAGKTSMGPVEVHALVNFVVAGPEDSQLTHYHIQLSRDARYFLSATVDPRDVEEVYQALRRDEAVMGEMQAVTSAYLRRCIWMEAG